MIKIHGTANGSEQRAAIKLTEMAILAMPEIVESTQIILELFPSLQCYGQNPQDIDLLVFFADYRADSKLIRTKSGVRIHSFCAVVEVKGHSPEDVRFEGNRCFVRYHQKEHDVSSQSEGQKYSVKNYIERNGKKFGVTTSPWLINQIWLTNVPGKMIPSVASNLLGQDVSWAGFTENLALSPNSSDGLQTFSRLSWLRNVSEIFSKKLQPSKIDRKRLEAITKSVLDGQKYADKLGQQLLIYRGRGGTGKTVRLIRTAYQAYDERGLRVLILTYNKALVADIRRMFALAGVSDVVGDRSVAIKTIHAFMHQWLMALEIITGTQRDFLQRYVAFQREALDLLKSGALNPDDVERARTAASRHLTWDLILIDECQDWPVTERDLLYRLYGHERFVIADGVDQFVRGVERIDWRENAEQSQVVSLRKSLRLKASLCQVVGHFAESVGLDDWNLEPLPESHGGKVVVITGDALSEAFHRKLAATAKSDGNRPIDILLCVPPSWVSDDGVGEFGNKRRKSVVAERLASWGYDVWDAVDPELRDEYPTSLDQYRVVQYESCRGLEGWVTVCFGLDEFFEFKRSNAEIAESARQDLYFEENVAVLEYAKRWLMIPLTRAIDTLVIHISDPSSYLGEVLKDLQTRHPEHIEWLRLD